MTQAEVKKIAHEYGCTATKRDGEWRVCLKGHNEDSAYYTDDNQDAADTAIVMARECSVILTAAESALIKRALDPNDPFAKRKRLRKNP